MEQETLRVFVYGTLMQGQRNHLYHCMSDEERGELLSVEAATIPVGTLYDSPFGFPYLVIDEETIKSEMFIGNIAEFFVSNRLRAKKQNLPRGSAAEMTAKIHGQLLTFTGTIAQLTRRLELLDALEGYGGMHTLNTCHYWRVLVNATTDSGTYPVWVWVCNPTRQHGALKEIPSGMWKDPRYTARQKMVRSTCKLGDKKLHKPLDS